MLVITAATAEELQVTLKLAAIRRHERHGGMHCFYGQLNGRDMILVQTGVGPKKAGAAANRILKTCAPTLVIAIGAAGAADPGLAVGDIVIAESMLHHDGGRFPSDEARSEIIARRLGALGMPVSRGDCYTTGAFIHSASQKRHIFRSTGARVIDMESASLGKRLHPAGVAFLTIRVVSDAAKQNAFNIEAYYAAKQHLGGFGAWAYFLKNPAELLRAAVLRKNVRLVAARTAAILERII